MSFGYSTLGSDEFARMDELERLYHRAYARQEREQEERAFRSDPDMRRPRREGSKEAIRALLQEDSDQGNRAVERAILVLFDRQTASEQAAEATNESNGVGFNGADAPFLCSLAKWITRSRSAHGRRLTPNQRARARRMLLKYSGQLAKIAAAKGASC